MTKTRLLLPLILTSSVCAYAAPPAGHSFTMPAHTAAPTAGGPFAPVAANYARPISQGVVLTAPATSVVQQALSSQHSPGSAIRLNSELTQPLMDFQNRQSDKELLLIDPRISQSGSPSLSIGAQFRASAMIGRTNTANRFSYLGRFPTDFVGTTVSDARLVHANQAFVGHFASWAHGYLETLFSDVFSFDAPDQGSFQVRQAYVVLGDLSQSPFYVFGGKKTVSFGDLGTLNPFSQAVPWHYFSPLAEGIGVGAVAQGFNISVTALNGSRGIRVADSDERGHLNNVAINALYRGDISDNSHFTLGYGYLRGSIYDGQTAEHLDASVTGEFNGLWDVNASFHWGPWIVQGEYVQTFEPWPVTDEKVTAWRLETALDFILGDKPLRVSGGFSEGIQGPAGSQFEFNRQLVIGVRYDPAPHVMMSLEYVRSSGFAPLINITTASDRSVVQDSVVLGLVLSI